MRTADPKGTARRVNAACQFMLSGRPSTRAFDNCFEMWDSHMVAAKVYRRALNNSVLMAAMPLYLNIELCRKDYEEFLRAPHELKDPTAWPYFVYVSQETR